MDRKSILKQKSLEFEIIIIEICRQLKQSKKEYVLYRQFLRSGTAIGALIREAEFAQSKADFISKLSIALKEAHTSYVLLLQELIKMLVASINTAKRNAGIS